MLKSEQWPVAEALSTGQNSSPVCWRGNRDLSTSNTACATRGIEVVSANKFPYRQKQTNGMNSILWSKAWIYLNCWVVLNICEKYMHIYVDIHMNICVHAYVYSITFLIELSLIMTASLVPVRLLQHLIGTRCARALQRICAILYVNRILQNFSTCIGANALLPKCNRINAEGYRHSETTKLLHKVRSIA